MPPLPPHSRPSHWSSEEFKRHGYAMVDLIADYWERVARTGDAAAWPVRSAREPGATAAMLPIDAPEKPEAWASVLADIERVVMPGLTHWQSPAFFGYFPANISGPSVLGELLSAGLGVQGMLWSTSPACTEIETRMLDWMGRAIGLPWRLLSAGAGGATTSGGGVIQGTASEGALVALVAARHRSRARGERGPWRVYTSTQAHSSIVKAAMIAGQATGADERDGLVGASGDVGGVRLISVDAQGRMDAAALAKAIEVDRAAGIVPLMVAATVGTTGTMAIDDLDAIGPVVKQGTIGARGAWLHVDAAMAGAACICPEHRWMLHGQTGTALEHVDSLGFNPHKGLLTNFDCSLFWTADRAALTSALAITPEYLRNAASEAGAVWDYRDWQVPLGRRFRSLKLWMVLRTYGLEGLRAHVREYTRLGEVFEGLVRTDARFEVASPARLGLVGFRLRDAAGGDGATKAVMERVNASGRAFVTHTMMPGTARFVIRLAIGGTRTEERHVREAWEAVLQNGIGDSPPRH